MNYSHGFTSKQQIDWCGRWVRFVWVCVWEGCMKGISLGIIPGSRLAVPQTFSLQQHSNYSLVFKCEAEKLSNKTRIFKMYPKMQKCFM